MSADYRLTRLRGQWAVAVWQDGKRIFRGSLGTGERKEAERQLTVFKAQYERPERLTVAYLWQAYRDANEHKRIASNMAFSGKAILPEFGHLLAEEITDSATRSYSARRRKIGRKLGTVWTELNHLQVVLNWAAKKNLIERSVSLERPSKPPPRDRRITRIEAQALLAAATMPHVALAIHLMIGTGARIGAILDLTWNRVDLDAGMVAYADPGATGRRKGRATVPVAPDLHKRLQEARKAALTDYVVEWAAKPVGSIKRGFARAVADAGLADVTPHVLRHTAASWMAEDGVPMTQIAAVLGHSDSRTTERIYAKFSPTYLRRAVASLDLSGVPSAPREPIDGNEGGT